MKRRPVWQLTRLRRFRTLLVETVKRIASLRLWVAVIVLPLALYVYREVTRDTLIIDPFSVPKSFQEAGLTSDVMANRIGDKVLQIEIATATRMKKDHLRALPDEGAVPEVEIPGTKLSLKTIIETIRSVFALYPKHVSGDVILATDSTVRTAAFSSDKQRATVTIYVTQGRNRNEASTVTEDAGNVELLIQRSAEAVLERVNPYVLAVYQYHHGQPKKAIALVDAMVRNESESGDQKAAAFVLWGNALMDEKGDDKALVKYQNAIGRDPSLANAHLNFGSLRFEKNKEAIAKYQTAAELDPKLADAFNGWGNALLSEGKDDEAIAKYQEAVEVNPKFTAAYNNWGNALVNKRKDDEAIVKYRRTVELDPKFSFAYNGWGNALLSEGKDDEAIVKYQKAIELDPNYQLAYENWGLALQHEGKYDEAAAKFLKADELSSAPSK